MLIPVILIVGIVVFALIHLTPGDPAAVILGDQATPEAVENLREQLGLNDPLPVQFGKWVGNVLTGDLGTSLWTHRSIEDELRRRVPITVELGLYSVIIGLIVALPIGIISAIRQDSWLDYACRSFSIGMISIPGFWLATLLLTFPLIWWGWAPPLTGTTTALAAACSLLVVARHASNLRRLASGTERRLGERSAARTAESEESQ